MHNFAPDTLPPAQHSGPSSHSIMLPESGSVRQYPGLMVIVLSVVPTDGHDAPSKSSFPHFTQSPLGCKKNLLSQIAHVGLPAVAEVPVAQSRQKAEPLSFMYFPTSHDAHVAWPVVGWYLPRAHRRHELELEWACARPALQSVQVVWPVSAL